MGDKKNKNDLFADVLNNDAISELVKAKIDNPDDANVDEFFNIIEKLGK